jgi:hypothetical protein
MPLYQYDPEKVESETKEEIEKALEHTLYFMINECGATRFQSKHDSADGRPWAPSIPKSIEFEQKMFHIQACCIRQLPKFGIEKPLEEDGFRTQEYWDWFCGWKGHIEGLPPEEWSKFETAINTHDDAYEKVSQWYPSSARRCREPDSSKTRFDTIDTEGGEPA